MFKKNCKKINTYKLCIDNVHRNKLGYQTPGSRSLTLLHTIVNGYPSNFLNRVISLSRESVFSHCLDPGYGKRPRTILVFLTE